MGRVTRSRPEALLRFPAHAGMDTLWSWTDSIGGRLRRTEGARLVDVWLSSAESKIVALLNAPDAAEFTLIAHETAEALGLEGADVEMVPLTSGRDRVLFAGEPSRPDPSRPNPRPVRWEQIDIGTDDRTLRIQFVHGLVDGLHHVCLYEDGEEVRVTIYLGLNHEWVRKRGEEGGGVVGVVLLGVTAWTSVTTTEPVGRRYVNDGADQ